jgi:hypothetical protein
MDSTVRIKKAAFDARVAARGPVLACYAPPFPGSRYETDSFFPGGTPLFVPISITGTTCELQCDHCRGTLLDTMVPVSEATFKVVVDQLALKGCLGLLVSGGADANGTVPVKSFLPAIAAAKHDHGFTVLLHCGFVDDEGLQELKDAGIDGVLFDVVGSEDTLRDICHVHRTPGEYYHMISTCKELGLPVVPHVVVGLDRGRIASEHEAIKEIAVAAPDVLVVVVLDPKPGTPMEDTEIDLAGAQQVLLDARLRLPSIPVLLGCARPHGEAREAIEQCAVECGYDGIAYPLDETIDLARNRGLEPYFHETCCALQGLPPFLPTRPPAYVFPREQWRLIDDGAYPVQLGLAIDDVLFEAMDVPDCQLPNTVRLYQFAPPAVVVGCNQDINEIDMAYIRQEGLQVGRRITGGGTIIMGVPCVDAQLGVSILVKHVPGFPAKLGTRYAILTHAIVHALGLLGIHARYQPNSNIIVDGRKITGQAACTTANLTFLHSTITFDYDLPVMMRVAGLEPTPDAIEANSAKFTTIRERIPGITVTRAKQALVAAIKSCYNAIVMEEPLSPDELDRARDLVREKHGVADYILASDGPKMGNCFL